MDTIRRMVDRLHFTDSDEANELLVSEPLALLVGFALDQQVTVQKAFMGPLVLKQRLGFFAQRPQAPLVDLEKDYRHSQVAERGGYARLIAQFPEQGQARFQQLYRSLVALKDRHMAGPMQCLRPRRRHRAGLG